MQQAFTGRVTQQPTTPPPTVAPATPAGQIVNPPTFQTTPTSPAPTPPTPPQSPTAAIITGATAGGQGSGIARNVQVVGDKDQNTILIVATPSEYSLVEQALRKLDVPSRQVMMEVTIAEVTLSDSLQFGVEWLFKGGAPGGRGSGGFFFPGSGGSTPFNPAIPPGQITTAPTLALSTGFNYIINNLNFLGGVQAILHMLDTYGNTRVINNPHLAALDNQKATIKSGDRIPINQQTFVGTTAGTSNAVTTTSQYVDTGVLLQVTPHINAGGLVTLEVQAEVSTPGTPANVGEAPPLRTRSVQSIVQVPTGRTLIMGGLIISTKGNTTNGFPLLDRIPVLGGLFGKQELDDNRTELILFITPRVIQNELDYDGVINDLRRRMENLDWQFPGTSTWPASPPNPLDQLNQMLTPRLGPFTPPPPTEPKVPPPPGQPVQTPPAISGEPPQKP